MPDNGRNGTPAYQRIQTTIRGLIEAGRLQPGDAVSSERELAKVHAVSLMTARHALAGLERQGIVSRRRGAGTFVAPSSAIILAKIIESEEEIAARLGRPAATQMVKIERVRHSSDEPFAFETCYLPADEFPGLVKAPLGKVSLFSTLESNYGVELAYADEEVDATAADTRVGELLAVPRGTPLLRMRQVIFSSKSKPIIYVIGLYRSEWHSLFIRRFR